MKKTPLHQWHVDNGANMAEFGSYSMPLWYPQGAKQEHLAVIAKAGLFDTSHMAGILVKGEDGHDLLQYSFSKDLDSCLGKSKTELVPGRSVYGVFLKENGYVLDDAIVSKVADQLYLVVVNAGMGAPLTQHLLSFTQFDNVEVTDLTDTLGKIDIQGPDSAKILARILRNPDSVFDSMVYFSFKGWFSPRDDNEVLLDDGTPVLLSRTGYTGEFGFEIFMDSSQLVRVWEKLLAAGEGELLPCGLAARDSLRAGAALPLSHQDIGDWPFLNNPWLFALPFDEDHKFTKDFFGADSLKNEKIHQYTYPFAGFDPRKITTGEKSAVCDSDEHNIGTILTCTTDMSISRVNEQIVSIATSEENGKPADFKAKGLCCGFVKVNKRLRGGEIVYLKEGRRKIKVEIREDIRPDRTARKPMNLML